MHYPGGLSPPTEDYHLSCITLGDISPPVKVTYCPLFEYFIPCPHFPNSYTGLVLYLYLMVRVMFGLATLIEPNHATIGNKL